MRPVQKSFPNPDMNRCMKVQVLVIALYGITVYTVCAALTPVDLCEGKKYKCRKLNNANKYYKSFKIYNHSTGNEIRTSNIKNNTFECSLKFVSSFMSICM